MLREQASARQYSMVRCVLQGMDGRWVDADLSLRLLGGIMDNVPKTQDAANMGLWPGWTLCAWGVSMTVRPKTDTHRRATRDMPREQYRLSEARLLLLVLIEQDPGFQSRAESVREQFPEFFGKTFSQIVSSSPGQPLGDWDETARWHPLPHLDNDSPNNLYCHEIEELTQDFGLRCKWAPQAIHMLVSEPGAYPGEAWWPQERTITIDLDVRVSPGTKWGDVKDGIMHEAKCQFEAEVVQIRKAAGFPARERGPDNLERDVKLLFQRICLGLGDLEIWNAWEREHDLDSALTYQRVREIISDTARLLEIAL